MLRTTRLASSPRRLSTWAVVLAVLALIIGCSAPPVQPAGPSLPGQALSTPAPATPTPTVAPRWKVVALGDSVTAGTNCACSPYPQAYGRALTSLRGIPTTVDNLGVGGLTSADVVSQLEDAHSPEATAVAAADIDLVTIGANDFGDQHDAVTRGDCLGDVDADDACVKTELAALHRNIVTVVTQIHRLRGAHPTAILVTGYWNVFEDGDVARSTFPATGVTATHVLTVRANTEIRTASQSQGATYVGLWQAFNGPDAGDVTQLLAADGDHPNGKGVAVIVDQLVAAGLPGLAD